MANDNHLAILIGLSAYVSPTVRTLNGPPNDVAAVRAWLVDPRGGDLPDDADHIFEIVSAAYPIPPGKAELDGAFNWLLARAAARAATRASGWRAGQRLYLYMSGHGFSSHDKACLLTGAATDQYTDHISPSAWIDWLQDAGYFRECILWMDSCMERVVSVMPNSAPANPFPGTNDAPGPSFVALAAPRPLLAAEKPLLAANPAAPAPADWRGVFSWNLVAGLRGAAANEYGMVTGRSLGDWLSRAQLSWLDAQDRISPSLAKTPALLQESSALIFARNVTPPCFSVALGFVDNERGGRVRLWTGSPPAPGPWMAVPSSGDLALKLLVGLYLAETDTGIRQGFAVTRPETIPITEMGRAPTMKVGGRHLLTIDSGAPDPEIRLFGERWQLIEGGVGNLSITLPYGLYEFRVLNARQIVEKVVLLDENWPQGTETVPDLPQMTSANPLPGTRTTHEYHEQAASGAAAAPDLDMGFGAELFVMARAYGETDGVARRPPWEGVSVHTLAGDLVADLTTVGQRHQPPGHDPWATCLIQLAPGAYELRFMGAEGKPMAQSLILPRAGKTCDWRVEAYLLRATIGGVSDVMPRRSFVIRPRNSPWGGDGDALLGRMAVALADDRSAIGKWLDQCLDQEFTSPLLGIIAAHMLLMNRKTANDLGPALFDDVVGNLRELLGEDFPDVVALSHYCSTPDLAAASAINAPPMFERSWRLLVESSAQNPQLVPASVWANVRATTASAPYFSWSTDEADRAAIVQAVQARLYSTPTAAAAPAAAAPGMAMDIVAREVWSGAINTPTPDASILSRRAAAMGVPQSAIETVPPVAGVELAADQGHGMDV